MTHRTFQKFSVGHVVDAYNVLVTVGPDGRVLRVTRYELDQSNVMVRSATWFPEVVLAMSDGSRPIYSGWVYELFGRDGALVEAALDDAAGQLIEGARARLVA